ncbi:MAG TPA: peptidoglycan DD-metalloendopeptidase family protein [bacterium]|nr:peptidoglycan DD-metalloendopeptidase family protein [bacterium]
MPKELKPKKGAANWKALFFIAFGALIAVSALSLFCRPGASDSPSTTPQIAPEPPTAGPASAPSIAAPQPIPATPQTATPPTPEKKNDTYALTVKISASFYNTFADDPEIARIAAETGKKRLAELLSAHVSRNLIWSLDMRREVYPGDEMKLLFRVISPEEQAKRADTPDEIELLAMQYRSIRLGKEIRFYQFKSSDRKFPAFYHADGTAVEKTLKKSPLKEWIQITSLLKDRRPRHDGLDFKAPVGTPIYAPWSGTVEKTNWKTRYNGYSLLARVDSQPAVQMLLLHLDKVHLKPGQRFAAGDHIADVGNTGRSFAPHLHYQLQHEAKKIIDPIKFHGTVAAKLPAADADAFQKVVQRFDALMGNK